MTIEESQKLMKKLIKYRNKYEHSGDIKDLKVYQAHEKICIDKFKYLVMMKVGRYKKFNNYEDLIQDGLEALVKSMKNYNPTKGIFFFGGLTSISIHELLDVPIYTQQLDFHSNMPKLLLRTVSRYCQF